MSKYYVVEEVGSVTVCTKIEPPTYTRIFDRIVVGYFDDPNDAYEYREELMKKYSSAYTEKTGYTVVVREIESNIEPVY